MAIVRILGALEAKVVAGATVKEVAEKLGIDNPQDKEFLVRGVAVSLETPVGEETVITVAKKQVGA